MLGKCSITQQHPQLSVFLTFYIASRLFAFVEKKKKVFFGDKVSLYGPRLA
jgi:hypothetical protein